VGAAAIPAETGDPTRFATARSVVKHAGLAPRERASGTYTGRTRIGRAGRPGLRLAAWPAAWAITRSTPVYAARFTHLTTRTDNRLSAGQARAARLHHQARLRAVGTTNPITAAGTRRRTGTRRPLDPQPVTLMVARACQTCCVSDVARF
jgi:hypothetical protein